MPTERESHHARYIAERIKASIQYEYDQKLETLKAKLNAESEIAIVKLTSQLQITANERSIKLTKVFEHQANAIATTYKTILILFNAALDYTQLMEHREPDGRAVARDTLLKAFDSFHNEYMPNRIYIPKPTRKNIDSFITSVRQSTRKFYRIEMLMKHSPSNEKTWKTLDEELDKLQANLPALLEALEDDFQNNFGFPINVAQPS